MTDEEVKKAVNQIMTAGNDDEATEAYFKLLDEGHSRNRDKPGMELKFLLDVFYQIRAKVNAKPENQ